MRKIKKIVKVILILVIMIAVSLAIYFKNYSATNDLPVSVYSQTVILQNLETGKIVMEKDKEKQVSVASLTKLVTVYLLLESALDLNEKVTIKSSVVNDLTQKGASLSGFLVEDEVTLKDLAYAIVLVSGGDAALLAAEYVSDSEATFVNKMNELANQIGMINTHFANAIGLDNSNHYSTVEDLNKFMNIALKNTDFAELVTTLSYQTNATNYLTEGYYLESTLLRDPVNLALKQGEILGGKTGFTDQAGLCLISIAEINNTRYLLITTGAKGNLDTKQFNIIDAHHIYDYISN